MLTIKNNLNKKNVQSEDIRNVLRGYSRINISKAEDVIHFTESQSARKCVELVKKWLTGEKIPVAKLITTASDYDHYDNAAYCASDAVSSLIGSFNSARYAVFYAISHASAYSQEKLKEYLSYARLFAYEDLNFPYKDISKTFNLDNDTDLNIFLDFLTDNYPEAITYPREEYFTNKLAKEYLKVIYQ